MMMPSIPSASSYSGGVSSSSAVVLVDKATSEFLIGPDWTINIDICDTVNSNQWLAKDVVKAVKRRLQHKNPKVQLLALTLLETMVKNCGDYVHFQIADRNILQEMVKIVKKKADTHVREKVLVLLDSWQEAFGGAGGKYPQYYWAYEELRRSGVEFPQRSLDTAPIFTPPITHIAPHNPQPGYGMPSNSSTRLDEAMAAEVQSLSLSSMNSMRDVLDLLADMLQAVNPRDRLAVKDEVIVDLVEQCRANQKKLMQMLTTTRDEELLGQGLDLNDSMQSVLAKHDAIASGLPLPIEERIADSKSSETHDSDGKNADNTVDSSISGVHSSLPGSSVTGNPFDEGEEEEDDFWQLARRHSKVHPSTSQTSPLESSGTSLSMNADGKVHQEVPLSPVTSNALVIADLPAPVTPKESQDIIDLLSITLSTSPMPEQNSQTHVASSGNPYQGPSPSMEERNIPYAAEGSNGVQVPHFHSYIAPWAKPQPEHQVEQPLRQIQQQANNPVQPYPQHNSLFYGETQTQQEAESQSNPQLSQYSSTGYPPPPWAATPGYYSNPNPLYKSAYTYPKAQAISSSHGPRNAQILNSVPGGADFPAMKSQTQVSSPRGNVPPAGQKPFIPSYKLFEELDVLGSSNGNIKTSSTSTTLSGSNRNQR